MKGATLAAIVAAAWLPLAATAAVIEDDRGHRLDINVPVDRVVTLAPHLAELMFDIEAEDRLVATVEWSDYPPAAKRVPRIGDAFRIDIERIMALAPDLVLAWGSGTPQNTLERLRSLGLPVAVLDSRDLESIPRHLEWLGAVTARNEIARERAREFREKLQGLRQHYSTRTPIRVFYQVSAQPLFTIGGGHTISELIRICGGENIFSDLDSRAHSVSREAVVSRDPHVVVAGRYQGSDEDVSSWSRWKEMSAVRSDNLYSMNAESLSRPAMRLIEGGREMCETLERARQKPAAQ